MDGPTLFDGATFDAAKDGRRLFRQLEAVRGVMLDGAWRTLAEIAAAAGCPEASASARLRDLRKSRFGAYAVERERVPGGNGLWRYRIAPKEGE